MAENFFGATDTGRLRDNNEDAFIAQDVMDGKYILACVIDGVGGYEGGEVAAALARDTIVDILSYPFTDVEKTLHSALRFSNIKIFEEKENGVGNHSMACVLTLALADIDNNKFYYAHIGDTRLYLLRGQSLVKVTKDHSFVGFLEDSGRLNEQDAMLHPKRNEINKALGFDPQLHLKPDSFDIGSSPFLPGDVLLLCSDGLSDLVSSSQMQSILTSQASLQHKCQLLIDAANTAGGKDNITVALVENNKERAQHKATKPVVDKPTRALETPRNEPAIVETRQIDIPDTETRKHLKVRPVWLILTVVMLLLIIAAAVWYTKSNDHNSTGNDSGMLNEPMKNAQEQMMQDSVFYGQKTLLLLPSSFDSSITISDTVIITKDSLRIDGNGMMLQAAPGYSGPVFYLSPYSVYVILENIVFQDFPVAIVSATNGLHLRNVRFVNCDVPVQYSFLMGQGNSFSGSMNDTLSTSDSSTFKPTLWR